MTQMNNTIFARVLALMLCVVMLAGTLLACDVTGGNVTTGGGSESSSTTTGDSVNDEPVEDVADPNEIFSASATIEDGALILGALKSGVLIGDYESVNAIIPEDVKIADGASSLALSVKKVLEDVELALGEGDTAQSLDVHVEGIALDNDVPMIVNLGAILEAGLKETELKLYHFENGKAALMTRVGSLTDFAIHNQYYYNAETGEVSIYVASFSVFSAVTTSADEWDGSVDTSWYNDTDTEFTLDTAAAFAGFRALVDGGNTFEGKTVTLGVDVNLASLLFDPIGYGYYDESKVNSETGADTNTVFMGTFDGGNHTIYNLYQNGWDLDPDKESYSTYTYSTAGGGLFASVKNATVKNLVVSGANIVFECVDMGIVVGYAQGVCHFENIVVTDSSIANYNRATGAVVGEVCYGPYGTDVSTEQYSHTFKNIVVDSNVIVSSLWGSFDTLCGGVIGGKWGDATVKMENVIVAAELDVYSDVTAAYQWYAYRRCGMLIGHTEQNSPKKALNAAAEFLTCVNVDVYYGDWTEYDYYQFTNQNNDKGNRYPWVRAEQGRNNGAFSNPRYGNPIVLLEDASTVTINTVELAEEHCTDHVVITFNQLYGGGQGVYGTNEHVGNGVEIHYNCESTTVYIENDAEWENLKLYYWFANGADAWTTLIDGIDMSGMLVEGNVYKIEFPAYAYGFKIMADEAESEEFLLENIEDKSTVILCDHETTTTKIENEVASSCTAEGSYDNVVYCSKCDKEISRETITVDVLDHNWNINTHKCSVCSVSSETKTIYFKNEWQWSDVRIYYWYTTSNGESNNTWPGTAMTKVDNDGTYDYYTYEVPEYLTGIVIVDASQVASDGSVADDKKTPDILQENIEDNEMFYMFYNSEATNKYQIKSEDFATYKAGFNVIYLSPNSNWTQSSAWFMAYVWDGSGDAWYRMSKQGDYYVSWIPQKYTNLIFCRMNSAASEYENPGDWSNVWNQTNDLTIQTSKNLYTIATGAWSKGSGSWSQYNP